MSVRRGSLDPGWDGHLESLRQREEDLNGRFTPKAVSDDKAATESNAPDVRPPVGFHAQLLLCCRVQIPVLEFEAFNQFDDEVVR